MRAAPVGEAAGERCGNDAGDADDAEGTGDVGAAIEARFPQMQRQDRPEREERAEEQALGRSPRAVDAVRRATAPAASARPRDNASAAAGFVAGRMTNMSAAPSSASGALIQNIARQPKCVPMTPAIVRLNRMPPRRPLMTAPTAAPRSAGGARLAANGSTCCDTVATKPITIGRGHQGGDALRCREDDKCRSKANELQRVISRRRSTMSPSGTRQNSPTA